MNKPILSKECPVCNSIFHKPRNVSLKNWGWVGFCCDNCRKIFISGHVPLDPLDRLFLRTVLAPGGCRLFDGDIRSGYGHAVYKGKRDLIHRVAYRIYYGGLPPGGRKIVHLCGDHRCINPEHFGVKINVSG